MAARSASSGTPVKSCSTTRVTTKGISSTRSALGAQWASCSTCSAETFCPSQLRSTDSSTMRIETGRRVDVGVLLGQFLQGPVLAGLARRGLEGLEGGRETRCAGALASETPVCSWKLLKDSRVQCHRRCSSVDSDPAVCRPVPHRENAGYGCRRHCADHPTGRRQPGDRAAARCGAGHPLQLGQHHHARHLRQHPGRAQHSDRKHAARQQRDARHGPAEVARDDQARSAGAAAGGGWPSRPRRRHRPAGTRRVPMSSGAGSPVNPASAPVNATCRAPVAAQEAASAHITAGRKRGEAKTDMRISLVATLQARPAALEPMIPASAHRVDDLGGHGAAAPRAPECAA